ncbi:endonuclease/exonuclease/phosphatase family protein [Singulisphaera acidiphila]|uniref:Metal-dependent hydrolase n=1 Tax=Singulisphaera acidiphila (strain ATCC BAA-1392 / DSM 18658 / VKM B-2454 / MOB10) TaxID=886293 RepID=L0DDH2_SINAD|nr:endonuclease/exonuclease/phosphatase family protein [Singulisphaera acidiphila]AGA27414.1 metal-dependent hydrolase [Singulisphaera acidiphila DSM 18658]
MRVLSYNIHKGIGGRDRRYRIDRIIRVIAEQEPDLICLQEVDLNVRRTRHDDQPRRLADAIQSAAEIYQLNVHLGAGGYGNLVLSRWEFRHTHQISLRQRRRKPRGAQLAIVETPEGPLHLINWHLGLAERERHWQVRHLLDHDCFRESATLPTLIIGDFNDWRNTLARMSFAAHGFEQLTVPHERFRSFPAYFPVVSLDKAFARGGIEVRQARVIRTPLAKRASDHLPLVIDFHVRPAAPDTPGASSTTELLGSR